MRALSPLPDQRSDGAKHPCRSIRRRFPTRRCCSIRVLAPTIPKIKSLRASREVYTKQLTDQVKASGRSLVHPVGRGQDDPGQRDQATGRPAQRATAGARGRRGVRQSRRITSRKEHPAGSGDERLRKEDGMKQWMPSQPGRDLERGGCPDRAQQPERDAEHGHRRADRHDRRRGSGVFHRIPRHERQDDGRRGNDARRAGARHRAQEHQAAPQAGRRRAGRGGLPHPAHEHRIQPQERRREHDFDGQRRSRRGQIDHAVQPGVHLRAGRLFGVDRGRRLAPPDAAQDFRDQQQRRPDELPDDQHRAGRRDRAHVGGESFA